MMHYSRLQKAIDYIEENLSHPIGLTDVSNAAFSSLSYFHRVFYFMTGFTVKEYIRRRRLSNAAYQLHCTELLITDIAFNAGYETLETFTRAFKKHYGVSPRAFRQENQEQPLFARLDILAKYTGQQKPDLDFILDLKYVLFKQVDILGFQTHTTLENGQQATHICHFANKIMTSNSLSQHFNLDSTPIFGVYTNMSDESEFNYTIGCLANTCIKVLYQLVAHAIPTARYEKFTLNRIDRIKEAWHYIYGYWFPENDQYRASGFDFEIYYPESVDIYIPMQV